MHTFPVMYVTFTVHCWINTRPLNSTQTTNLKLYSNQSINKPHSLVWGDEAPKKYFCPESPYLLIGPCSEV